MLKKILKITAIILVVFIVALALWIKLMPRKKISFLTGKDNLAAKVLCLYPVKIQGSSMEPVFKGGKLINFNKCFNKEELPVNTIIMFKSGNILRTGRIRKIKEGESGKYYEVSPEARPEDINDIYPDMVEAIYNE